MSEHGPGGLHLETLGDATADDRPVVALVHGFTQNSRCWAPFDQMIAEVGPVTAVDLPGHGLSGPATVGLWETGQAVLAAAPASVHVGYSLGGRVLLHGALSSPGAVSRLVLIGAHPGIEDHDARHARQAEDLQRAVRLEQGGLTGFLDEWMALPLFAGLDPERGHREERLANDAASLGGALRLLGTGTQEPLWDRLRELTMPVLVLAGERDGRFCEIGQRTAAAIGPNALFVMVPGVGHVAQLEDPGATSRIIADWMTPALRSIRR